MQVTPSLISIVMLSFIARHPIMAQQAHERQQVSPCFCLFLAVFRCEKWDLLNHLPRRFLEPAIHEVLIAIVVDDWRIVGEIHHIGWITADGVPTPLYALSIIDVLLGEL